MRVSIVKRKTPAVKKFEEIEWPIVDFEHYGSKDINFQSKYFFLKAEEDNKVVGILQGRVQAGVCTIHDIIVGHDDRGKGIGKELMGAAEKFAHKQNAHKISLVTGTGWPAIKFYEQLGYQETGRRLNDMLHVDFIEYTKFIG